MPTENENQPFDLAQGIGEAFAGTEINTDNDFEPAIPGQEEEEIKDSAPTGEENPEGTPEETPEELAAREAAAAAEGEGEGTEDKNTSQEGGSLKDEAGNPTETGDESQTDNNNDAVITTEAFDRQLAERTSGKFNTLDEVLAKLDEKPENPFFDEEVERINELKKSGVKLDQDWFKMQTTDYENMSEPIDVLAEEMRMETPGMTDKEIEYEIREKYHISKWGAEDGEDLTPQEQEMKDVFSAKMVREAEVARDKMIKKRDSQSYKVEADPEAEAKAIASAKAIQEKWSTNVDEVISNVSKLTTKVSENEVFDLVLDDSDKKETSDLLKSMGSEINSFWNRFVTDGKIDHTKLFRMITRDKNYDKAVMASYQKGSSAGKEAEVKNIKNVDFSADSKPTVGGPTGLEAALIESLSK